MSRKLTVSEIAEVKRRARALGGELLSRSLSGVSMKLRFRCAKGHRFEVTPRKLEQGNWCMACARAKKNDNLKANSAARLQRILELRGGRMLSAAFIDSRTPLRLQCQDGHEWTAVPKDTLRGSWCRVCALERKSPRGVARQAKELRQVRSFIRRQRGTILIPGLVAMAHPVRVRCQHGHEWLSLPQHLLVEVWCQQCLDDQMLQRAREVARSHGGECLSDKCTSRASMLDWRCALGHVFRAREGLVRDGMWCARCHSGGPHTIEAMRELAATRGGLCLSKEYKGAVVKLRWRCREGHVWLAQPGSVRQGSWCRACHHRTRGPYQRWTIEDIQQMAFERWGKCLSKRYQGTMAHLRWQCARGHIWEATPMQVQQEHWCPMCSARVPGSLAGMTVLAAEHGGRVLTTKWIDHSVPVEFECAKGHRFAHQSVIVKSGAWCPTCRALEAFASTPPHPRENDAAADAVPVRAVRRRS